MPFYLNVKQVGVKIQSALIPTLPPTGGGTFAFTGGKLSWAQNGRFLFYSQREYYNPGKGNKVIAFSATGGKRQPMAKVNWKQPVSVLKTTLVLDLPEAGNVPFVWQEAK